VKDLADHRIDQTPDIATADPIAITIDGDKASPRAVRSLLEDGGGCASIHHRVGTTSVEQTLELARRRTEGRRAPYFVEIREDNGGGRIPSTL
jgi:hypothetical protein